MSAMGLCFTPSGMITLRNCRSIVGNLMLWAGLVLYHSLKVVTVLQFFLYEYSLRHPSADGQNIFL